MHINEDFFDDENVSSVASEIEIDNTEKEHTHIITFTYKINRTWLQMNREYIVTYFKRLSKMIKLLDFAHVCNSSLLLTNTLGSNEIVIEPELISSNTIEAMMNFSGSEYRIIAYYNIITVPVKYTRFIKNIRTLFAWNGSNTNFRNNNIVIYKKDNSEEKYSLYCDGHTFYTQDMVANVYEFLYGKYPKTIDNEKYSNRNSIFTSKVHYFYYLHVIDKKPLLFDDYIVCIYGLIIPVKSKLTIYITVAPLTDEARNTGSIIDFVYKKILGGMSEYDIKEFKKPDNMLETNIYIYTDSDSIPSKSKYTGKTLNINDKDNNYLYYAEPKEPSIVHYMEFVGKDWKSLHKENINDENDRFYMERMHDKWKNMKFVPQL